MNKENYRIVVCSLPDREELVAEIYYKNKYWSEISAEVANQFIVQFYNHPEKGCWEFPFDEAMEVLQEAKERLAKLQRTPEEQKRYEELQKEWAKYEQEWEAEQKRKNDQDNT